MPNLKFQTFIAWIKFSSEEVMDKLDMFQSIYVKIDEFGWWDLEIISVNVGSQFTFTEFKE